MNLGKIATNIAFGLFGWDALAPSVLGASSLLPPGIGAMQYGYRQYQPQQSYFDRAGNRGAIGEKYSQDLNGSSLLAGRGGEQLKALAIELQRYKAAGGGSLGDALELGEVGLAVKAQTRAQFMGGSFGLTRGLTLFVGVPWIEANVDAKLSYTGKNNAAELKDQLGGLAYKDLSEGLDRAASLNDAVIDDRISSYGYDDLGTWRKRGMGDIVMGAKTEGAVPLASATMAKITVTPSASIPTGYLENPDILQDVNFGKGYYALSLGLEEELGLQHYFTIGTAQRYTDSLPSKARRRVPIEDEIFVEKDRTRSLTFLPGDETDFAIYLGASYSLLSCEWRRGVKRHFGDRYHGELEGNYAALAKQSDNGTDYELISADLSTVEAYRRRRFVLPVILKFEAYRTLAAINSIDDRYYQLSVTSFFDASGTKGRRTR